MPQVKNLTKQFKMKKGGGVNDCVTLNYLELYQCCSYC